MSRENGAAHGLAYDPVKGIIYEVNHPINRDGLWHWLEGIFVNSVPTDGIDLDETKSVAYQWSRDDKKQWTEFWEREKGNTFLLSPVTVPNPAEAAAWFQSQQGKAWNYNFFTNNCGDYACKGMNAGGAGINTSWWARPSQFPGTFTMSWSSGQLYPTLMKK